MGRKCDILLAKLRGPIFPIYLSYFLASWRARMWPFALGLYLVLLAGKSLRLAAISGFCQGGAILLFGGFVGDWIDQNRRLKVMRVVLAIQGVAVGLCTISLSLVLVYQAQVTKIFDGGLWILCQVLLITLAIIAALASIAYQISLIKDWVVEVVGKDTTRLAGVNAWLRRLNLTCTLLGPMVIAQIMTFGSILISTITVACWIGVSVVVEYVLLGRVYKLVPSLAKSRILVHSKNDEDNSQEKQDLMLVSTVVKKDNTEEAKSEINTKTQDTDCQGPTAEVTLYSDARNAHSAPSTSTETACSCQGIWNRVRAAVMGWRVYSRQRVMPAGLGLAFLYFTVMSFDSMTTGYLYAQGLQESMLGWIVSLGGLTGIIATFVYVELHKRIGLVRTGFVGFAWEVSFLVLCVVSIWCPGSPFNLSYSATPLSQLNCTDTMLPTASTLNVTLSLPINRQKRDTDESEVHLHRLLETYPLVELSQFYEGLRKNHVKRQARDVNHWSPTTQTRHAEQRNTGSSEITALPLNTSALSTRPSSKKYTGSKVSLILFIVGMILSRPGVYLADLAVHQLLQETVKTSERGIVNGVQNSLHMLLEMLKYITAAVLPGIHTFGILIIATWTSIFAGTCSYAYYWLKVQSHEHQGQGTIIGEKRIRTDEPTENSAVTDMNTTV